MELNKNDKQEQLRTDLLHSEQDDVKAAETNTREAYEAAKEGHRTQEKSDHKAETGGRHNDSDH